MSVDKAAIQREINELRRYNIAFHTLNSLACMAFGLSAIAKGRTAESVDEFRRSQWHAAKADALRSMPEFEF